MENNIDRITVHDEWSSAVDKLEKALDCLNDDDNEWRSLLDLSLRSALPSIVRAYESSIWRPIETMPLEAGQVFLATKNGGINTGIVLGEYVFLWKTNEPINRDNYSYWMPIQKVPE